MPPRNVYRPPGARQGHDENRGSTNRPSPNTTGGGHSRASIPGVDVGSRLKPPHSTPGLLKDGTINFEYILTPSRSSGLDKGGDVLKDWKVQEDYWQFIQKKINAYWNKYPWRFRTRDERDVAHTQQRAEVEGNLLILLRKLREGISSSRRTDAFATSIYEQSFYLSIIFSIPAQTTAILPHLLPARAPLLKLGDDRPSLSAKPWIVILGLLHTLIAHHPSQTAYFDLIRATARAPTPHSKASTSSSHPGVDWVIRIAQALRRHMLIQLNLLTRPEAVDAIIISMFPSDTQANLDRETVTMSLYTLVRGIRSKAKNDAWKVLRSAYPQFDLGPNAPHSEGKTSGGSEGGGKVDDTRRWLVRVLSLDSEKSNTEGKASGNDTELTVERWFTEREKSGEVQRAGPNASGTTVEGRWVVKVKR